MDSKEFPKEKVSALSAQKRKILDFIEKNGEITETEIGEMLCVKRTRAYTIAKQMCDDGYIVCVGRGKGKKYLIPNSG